jgi:hypothetical protein
MSGDFKPPLAPMVDANGNWTMLIGALRLSGGSAVVTPTGTDPATGTQAVSFLVAYSTPPSVQLTEVSTVPLDADTSLNAAVTGTGFTIRLTRGSDATPTGVNWLAVGPA